MSVEFQTSDDLALRLATAVLPNQRPVVFLLGSGVCLPNDEGRGVPGTRAIMALIEAELGKDWVPVHDYQAAFAQLIRRRGEDGANHVVRKAVLRAKLVSGSATPGQALGDDDLERLELDTEQWWVPDGLLALAALSAHFPRAFGRSVLTTNFDPLIEIALSRQAVVYFSSALHADGSLLYLSGVGTHVVHLHGFWRGSDTLHTQAQLSPDRPQLADSVRHILGNATLAILGYGGWDDLFMKTLATVVAGSSVKTDILWGFHEHDADELRDRYGHVLATLDGAAKRGRAQLYRGVSANAVLMEAFRMATDRLPAQDTKTFLNRVELARTGRVRYPGLAEPWSKADASLGDYAKLFFRLEPVIAAKAVLFAAEYLLPQLERQNVHAARVISEQYGYIREAVGRALTLLTSGESHDASLSGAVSDMWRDSKSAVNDSDRLTLLVCADAVAAALAQVGGTGVYAVSADPDFERSAATFAATAIHRAARILQDDDGALWGYISRRLGGGHDHLWRFW